METANLAQPLQTKKQRDSNLELLRLIAMFLIVIHHSVVDGNLLSESTGFGYYFASVFFPIGKIAFNAFIALSTWFLVDAKFKSKRAITVIGEVIFYAITVYLVSCIFTKNFSVKDFFSNLLPISGNIHGFATAYISFYLLTPLLSKIVKGFTHKQALWAMIITIYLQAISYLVSYLVGGWHDYSSTISLFIMFFFVSYYFKHYAKVVDKWWIGLIMFVVCWVVAWLLRDPLPMDEHSIINIIGGFGMFLLFKNMPSFKSKPINYIAGSTFGVLLIHSHVYFKHVLWTNIFPASAYAQSVYLPLFMVITSIIIFISCILIDIFRREIIEKYTFKLCKLDKLCARLDSIWITSEPTPTTITSESNESQQKNAEGITND